MQYDASSVHIVCHLNVWIYCIRQIDCFTDTPSCYFAPWIQCALYLWPPGMQKFVISCIFNVPVFLWKAEKVSYILPFVLHALVVLYLASCMQCTPVVSGQSFDSQSQRSLIKVAGHFLRV